MQPHDILLLIFMVCGLILAIVAMALGHQRKMAELASRTEAVDAAEAERIAALRTSVDELRTQLHAQMIQIDTLIGRQAKMLDSPKKAEDVQGRLGAGEP